MNDQLSSCWVVRVGSIFVPVIGAKDEKDPLITGVVTEFEKVCPTNKITIENINVFERLYLYYGKFEGHLIFIEPSKPDHSQVIAN